MILAACFLFAIGVIISFILFNFNNDLDKVDKHILEFFYMLTMCCGIILIVAGVSIESYKKGIIDNMNHTANYEVTSFDKDTLILDIKLKEKPNK